MRLLTGRNLVLDLRFEIFRPSGAVAEAERMLEQVRDQDFEILEFLHQVILDAVEVVERPDEF